MTLRELRALLAGKEVDDVFIAGFVDMDEIPLRFRALYRAVFVGCGGKLLRFGAIGSTARMLISEVKAVSLNVELDDGMQPAFTSVSQTILNHPDGPNRLATLRLWDALDGADGVECAAARLDLQNGQQLFFDPSYYFGVRLGGREQEGIWAENWPEICLKSIDLDVSGNSS